MPVKGENYYDEGQKKKKKRHQPMKKMKQLTGTCL